MTARSLGPLLLRHLANLCSPGLIFLTLFVAVLRFQEYPLWRLEVILAAALIIAVGLPFGVLISLRPKTFGAAAVTLVLLLWSTQFAGPVAAGSAVWQWATQ